MESLVTQIVALLGVDPGAVQMVLAGLLDIARDSLGPEASAALIVQIPGAAEMMADNLIGSGLLGSLLSSGPDSAARLADLVRDSGLAPDQVATIADMFLGYVQQTAGADAANQIYNAIPALGQLG